jgi:hypothetical protein
LVGKTAPLPGSSGSSRSMNSFNGQGVARVVAFSSLARDYCCSGEDGIGRDFD